MVLSMKSLVKSTSSKSTELSLNLLENVSLSPYTTWKVGGNARWFVEPTLDEVPSLINWAHRKGIAIYYLGRGSNVLISDDGLPGLVISTRNSMTELRGENYYIVAESDVFLPHLSQFAAKEGFSDFEFLIEIPGTVDSALVMNAGLTMFRPREMVSIVENFDVLNFDGSVETLTISEVGTGYRQTDLLSGKRFISKVRFRLKEEDRGDPNEIFRQTFEYLRERKRKQPLDKPTIGSTFKSCPGSQGAGWYIDQAGLKGCQMGGARVNPVHANWIENTGEATAAAIRQLIAHVQSVVEACLGVCLEPEVRYLS